MDSQQTAAISVPSSAYLYQRGESELRWLGETQTHFLATGAQTGAAFCLVDERAVLGEAVHLHRHPQDMESFFVVEGEITIYIGDRPGARAKAGAFAHIPAGEVHGFRVTSETARYLILTTAHHGEFYRAISLPSEADNRPPSGHLPEGAIRQACIDYDIEFVGPLPKA